MLVLRECGCSWSCTFKYKCKNGWDKGLSLKNMRKARISYDEAWGVLDGYEKMGVKHENWSFIKDFVILFKDANLDFKNERVVALQVKNQILIPKNRIFK